MTLAFWGWQADFLIAAVPAALAIEIAAFSSFRFDFELKDFRRIASLCLALVAGLALYTRLEAGSPHAAVQTVKLLPLAALPLILAQVYSTTSALRFDTLLRFGAEDKPVSGADGAHFGFPYFALCLLATAAANVRAPWFYAASIGLCAWALWPARSPRYSPLSWIVLFGSVAGCGYVGQQALPPLQLWLIDNMVALYTARNTDPYRATTAIGHIGELKLSDEILVRVKSDQPIPNSVLLHQASYDSYANGSWLARDARLAPMSPDESGTRWTLDQHTNPNRRVTIVTRLAEGKGVLPLPSGTGLLTGLTVDGVKRNRLGTVRIERQTRYVSYAAHYRHGSALVAPPNENDLKVPSHETPALAAFWDKLDAEGKPLEARVNALSDYFRDHFSYSLYQGERERNRTHMQDFLQHTRAGHCELFATATVLLLRAAGIPARYATGHSVQEHSALENAYIIRERHAHAWARIYLNGAWHDIDTTPSSWAEAEAERASMLEPLMDWLSWLRFRFDQWRASDDSAQSPSLWLALLVTLLGYVAWRLRLHQRRRTPRANASDRETTGKRKGADSHFYRIEQCLLQQGLARGEAEPVKRWLQRLAGEGIEPNLLRKLDEIVALHYRYRFDPNALADDERLELARCVSEWLRHYASSRVADAH